jgi:ribosomal protein L12E/L44/L45/RPP1/RPP2
MLEIDTMTDINIAAQREEWRQKALANTLTDEEMREWIKMVRAGRSAAATSSASSRAKRAPVNLDTMIDELDNL